jgi:hypothetical protein
MIVDAEMLVEGCYQQTTKKTNKINIDLIGHYFGFNALLMGIWITVGGSILTIDLFYFNLFKNNVILLNLIAILTIFLAVTGFLILPKLKTGKWTILTYLTIILFDFSILMRIPSLIYLSLKYKLLQPNQINQITLSGGLLGFINILGLLALLIIPYYSTKFEERITNSLGFPSIKEKIDKYFSEDTLNTCYRPFYGLANMSFSAITVIWFIFRKIISLLLGGELHTLVVDFSNYAFIDRIARLNKAFSFSSKELALPFTDTCMMIQIIGKKGSLRKLSTFFVWEKMEEEAIGC